MNLEPYSPITEVSILSRRGSGFIRHSLMHTVDYNAKFATAELRHDCFYRTFDTGNLFLWG